MSIHWQPHDPPHKRKPIQLTPALFVRWIIDTVLWIGTIGAVLVLLGLEK